MKLFSVAPFDQHLTLDGQALEGDMESLAALNVFPGSILYLKVRRLLMQLESPQQRLGISWK